jgi:hypothetical protein
MVRRVMLNILPIVSIAHLPKRFGNPRKGSIPLMPMLPVYEPFISILPYFHTFEDINWLVVIAVGQLI